MTKHDHLFNLNIQLYKNSGPRKNERKLFCIVDSKTTNYQHTCYEKTSKSIQSAIFQTIVHKMWGKKRNGVNHKCCAMGTFVLRRIKNDASSSIKLEIKNALVVRFQGFQHDLVSEPPGLTRRTWKRMRCWRSWSRRARFKADHYQREHNLVRIQ